MTLENVYKVHFFRINRLQVKKYIQYQLFSKKTKCTLTDVNISW